MIGLVCSDWLGGYASVLPQCTPLLFPFDTTAAVKVRLEMENLWSLAALTLRGTEEERRGLRSRQGKLRIRGEFDSYVPSNSQFLYFFLQVGGERRGGGHAGGGAGDQPSEYRLTIYR